MRWALIDEWLFAKLSVQAEFPVEFPACHSPALPYSKAA